MMAAGYGQARARCTDPNDKADVNTSSRLFDWGPLRISSASERPLTCVLSGAEGAVNGSPFGWETLIDGWFAFQMNKILRI